MKRCPRCKKRKRLDAFGPNAATPSGLQTYCRPCNREAVAQHRVKNRARKNVKPPWKYKRCTTCKKRKLCEKFNKNLSLWDGIHNECRNCQRDRYYKDSYGIDNQQKQELLRRQKGRCAICGLKFKSRKSTHVDHCHRTKCIRGLLCVHCNVGIGQLKDSLKLLRRAIMYLKRKR